MRRRLAGAMLRILPRSGEVQGHVGSVLSVMPGARNRCGGSAWSMTAGTATGKNLLAIR
jgi:hypothetical protein